MTQIVLILLILLLNIENIVESVNTITTYAGYGTSSGSDCSGCDATSVSLSYPYGVCFDTSNNLYVVDSKNSKVRKVTTTGLIYTVIGGGASGSSGIAGTSSNMFIRMDVLFIVQQFTLPILVLILYES